VRYPCRLLTSSPLLQALPLVPLAALAFAVPVALLGSVLFTPLALLVPLAVGAFALSALSSSTGSTATFELHDLASSWGRAPSPSSSSRRSSAAATQSRQAQASAPASNVIDVRAEVVTESEEDWLLERLAFEDLEDFDRRLRDLGSDPTVSYRPLAQWTPEDVAAAAQAVGLGRFCDMIVMQRVDGAVAAVVTEAELKDELGVTVFGDRKRLMALFQELRTTRN
jgi:hypothetical protein